MTIAIGLSSGTLPTITLGSGLTLTQAETLDTKRRMSAEAKRRILPGFRTPLRERMKPFNRSIPELPSRTLQPQLNSFRP